MNDYYEKELPMSQVDALYLYPVRGSMPEQCDSLMVLDEVRIAGSRMFGIRFADTEGAEHAGGLPAAGWMLTVGFFMWRRGGVRAG